jgi:predicted ribosomally synthesized peptide with SipW-like signal peptide
MKKLLFVLMACVLCIGLVGGAFAYFSDTETSTGNTFTAGTLDLKIDVDPTSGVTWEDGPLGAINDDSTLNDMINNMAPGDSISGNFGIKNDGTIEGVADFKLIITGNDDNGLTEPEQDDGDVDDGPGNGELCENVDVVLTYNGSAVYSGTLAAMDGINYTAPSNIAGGATASWEFTISIGTGVNNVIQSDTCTFDVEFSLNQAP